MSVLVNEKNIVDEEALGKAIADNLWAKVAPALEKLESGSLTVIGTFGGVAVNAVFGWKPKEEAS
jgi:hypothetical protein